MAARESVGNRILQIKRPSSHLSCPKILSIACSLQHLAILFVGRAHDFLLVESLTAVLPAPVIHTRLIRLVHIDEISLPDAWWWPDLAKCEVDGATDGAAEEPGEVVYAPGKDGEGGERILVEWNCDARTSQTR